MMITSGTMTNRIDQLAKAGLVCRTADPDDARKAVVKLTTRGFKLIDKAIADHVETQKSLLANLSTEEFKTLDRLLKELLTPV